MSQEMITTSPLTNPAVRRVFPFLGKERKATGPKKAAQPFPGFRFPQANLVPAGSHVFAIGGEEQAVRVLPPTNGSNSRQGAIRKRIAMKVRFVGLVGRLGPDFLPGQRQEQQKDNQRNP